MTIDNKTTQKLGRQKVLDENGDATVLATLWRDQRVVLVFIRHFG